MVVMHKCDNPPCVRPDHLAVGTQAENIRDCKRKGRISRIAKASGEKNGNSILTKDQIVEIRQKYASGKYTLKDLGGEYKTHFSNISLIVRNKVWK